MDLEREASDLQTLGVGEGSSPEKSPDVLIILGVEKLRERCVSVYSRGQKF